MTEYTEKILNKIAYADGGKTVNEEGLTLVDGGKTYKFGLGPVAYALNAPRNMNPVQGIAYRLLGFKAEDD